MDHNVGKTVLSTCENRSAGYRIPIGAPREHDPGALSYFCGEKIKWGFFLRHNKNPLVTKKEKEKRRKKPSIFAFFLNTGSGGEV